MNNVSIKIKNTLKNVTSDEIIEELVNFSDYKIDFNGLEFNNKSNSNISEFYFHALIDSQEDSHVLSDYPNTHFNGDNDSGEDMFWIQKDFPFWKVAEVKSIIQSNKNNSSTLRETIKTSLTKSFGNDSKNKTKTGSYKKSKYLKPDIIDIEKNLIYQKRSFST